MNGRTNSTSTGAEFIEIPLDPVTNLNAEAGDGSVRLTLTDPKNKYATDEGETAQDPDQLVSVWKYTKVVRKTGAYPQNPNDGVVVVESGVHNQYQSSPYIDEGLTNDTTYYYSVYAINEDEIESNPVQITVTPVAGVALSSLAEGSIVKINENGSPVEFYILQHNYEPELNPEGRTLISRTKNLTSDPDGLYGSYVFDSGNGYDFLRSDIYNTLNTDYLSRFSTNVKNLISTTNFLYRARWSNKNPPENGSCSIFMLSAAEHEGPTDGINDYFTDGELIPLSHLVREASYAELRGYQQWTRSAGYSTSIYNNNHVVYTINVSGEVEADRSDRTNYVVPVFTLPNDARFNENNVLIDQ